MVSATIFRRILNDHLYLLILLISSTVSCTQAPAKLPQEKGNEGGTSRLHDEGEVLAKIDYFAERPFSDQEAKALRVLRSGDARISRDVLEGNVFTVVHLDGTWNGEASMLKYIEDLYSVAEISFPSDTTKEQFDILSTLDVDLKSILVKSATLSEVQSDILRKKYPNASIFDGSEHLINAEND